MLRFSVLWIFGSVLSMSNPACHSTPQPAVVHVNNWYEQLPPCPCENPDKNGIKLNDGWAKDEGNIRKYHPGSTECFRSYPAVKTLEGMSGQQCCYDVDGKLITGGCAAGTPDKASTCDGEDANGVMITRYSSLWAHYTRDVRPWEAFGGTDSGWVRYNLLWVPDNRSACETNIITRK